MRTCFVCGSKKLILRPATDLHCLMGETVLVQCGGCGAEWFDDTDEAKKLLKKQS